ncbi:MAG: GNAT family N-acetyltransferase [Acidimicrobiia bacterium]|nr:MAG: GNAT family N-acetyltransferase [Acidimicrobiia bacterium]
MIRWASAADSESIARVQVASWVGAYRGLIPDSVIDRHTVESRTATWNRFFAEPPPRSAMFVAEHIGEIVGMAQVGPTRDEDLNSDRIGEVLAIYVTPEHWGHGHGRDIMSESLAWLRDSGFFAATLWVLDTNTRSRAFYEAGRWRLDEKTKIDETSGGSLSEVRYRIGLPQKS